MDQCCQCGRIGKRDCPALKNQICPSCCGSKRGSQLECPSDCGYYPFSIKGYDLWLKVDETIHKKLLNYVVNHYGKEKFLDLIEEMRIKKEGSKEDDLTAIGVALHHVLFIERGKQEKSLAEQWEAEGWMGLNNDEQVMMRYRAHTKVAVVEVQKVLDHQTMECINLLDPEPKKFLLLDRHTAAKIVRFQQIFIWLTYYPHFSRICNGGVEISDSIQTEFLNELKDDFAQEQEGNPNLTMGQYLSEKFIFYCRRIQELTRAKWQATLYAMDLHQCIAMYDLLTESEQIKAILDQYPDFRWQNQELREEDPPETLYYTWLRLGESKALEKEMEPGFRYDAQQGGIGTIGNVRLYLKQLCVETFTKQKFEFAKKMIHRYFGDKVSLKSERIVDLAKQFARRQEEGFEEDKAKPQGRSSDTVPQDIQEKLTTDFYKNQYRKFLEDPIPMLDGKTPREAASDPQLRPKLVELMKSHLSGMDRQNKTRNLKLDIGWVLEELGLEELK